MTHAAFSVHPTPIGEALIVVTDEGLAHLEFLEGPAGDAVQRIGLLRHAVPVADAAATADVRTQLDEYFAGERRRFDLPLDLGVTTGFVRAALEAVTRIPFGQTASYAEIAIEAGSPGANRAVGSACARTPISLVIPAHRVVRSDGSIGEYGGHPERKRYLLDLEERVAAADPSGV
ncbi:methylated-DNA--[protein]-cysteine S-methyltransferase [Microbacterium memoriense]|uniref:Methylated-DNA--[protein]-cysteine S-methyltransferase n=1 Tax=Microbacterium memoriense TaxID=2978350 RepID=A0ABT2P8N8_9MICO|nr:methylated-DNA--[protein]-cysteine S-methyltransferase [Microbacterium memoriense]MCT9001009.1 methylated-DNA--[protein]-cysteine S-methyltransferase [Microbacterium memoriense]